MPKFIKISVFAMAILSAAGVSCNKHGNRKSEFSDKGIPGLSTLTLNDPLRIKIIKTIKESWKWKGIVPAKIVSVNNFGNVIVLDDRGKYWRICPEEVTCEIIARNDKEFKRLISTPKFVEDWEMKNLVDMARKKFGSLPEGRCYCLKRPGVLGGKYVAENMSTITIDELLGFTGYLGLKIKDLPDGAQIQLKVVP